MRVLTILAIGLGATVVGCGDCITLGYPSASIVAADAGTRTPLSLTNAVITYTSKSAPPVTDSLRWTWSLSDPYLLCCLTGQLRVQVMAPGYLAADTTVSIRSKGSCHVPVFTDVTVFLR